jgi:hypothetical protein
MRGSPPIESPIVQSSKNQSTTPFTPFPTPIDVRRISRRDSAAF